MKINQKIYCPNCGDRIECKIVPYSKTIVVRGELFKVHGDNFLCPQCGMEFIDFEASKDPLAEAFDLYRKKHHMMKPEEIRQLRNSYGLTQQELADLLDLSRITLSRYENGALQDIIHDEKLKVLRMPHKLRELLAQKPHIISDEKRKRIIRKSLGALLDIHRIKKFWNRKDSIFFNKICDDTKDNYSKITLRLLLDRDLPVIAA